MKKRLSKANLLFLALLLGAVFLGIFSHKIITARADNTQNLRGYAKLLSTGTFISFNCFDDVGGGQFPFNFPIYFSITPCTSNTHGVNIDSSGNFSGKAWSYVWGDINFQATSTTPNEAWRSHCSSCTLGSCSACLVRTTDGSPGTVYGYAQVVQQANSSVDNHGWINLSGLTIDSYNGSAPGSFNGTSTDTPSSIGSIGFNCAGDGSCNSSANGNIIGWHAYMWAPWVAQMTAPNWFSSNACVGTSKNAVLKWTLAGGQEKAWQVIVSTSSVLNTTSPYFTDSGTDASVSYNCGASTTNCRLNYGTNYYWWLKIWYALNAGDPQNAWASTTWIQFDHSATGMGVSNGPTPADNFSFLTYSHEFPQFYSPYVTATPTPFIVNTSSVFTVSAQYFTGGPGTYQTCDASHCSYSWSSSDTGGVSFTPTSSTNNNTSVVFAHATNTPVTVTVTDLNGNYSCSFTTSTLPNFAQPYWKEVKTTN